MRKEQHILKNDIDALKKEIIDIKNYNKILYKNFFEIDDQFDQGSDEEKSEMLK